MSSTDEESTPDQALDGDPGTSARIKLFLAEDQEQQKHDEESDEPLYWAANFVDGTHQVEIVRILNIKDEREPTEQGLVSA